MRQRTEPTSTNLRCGLTIFSPLRLRSNRRAGVATAAVLRRPERGQNGESGDAQAEMIALSSSFSFLLLVNIAW